MVLRIPERVVRHSEFFALIDERGATHAVQNGRERLRRGGPVVGVVVAEPGHDAGLVVVVPIQAVPTGVRQRHLPPVQRLLQGDQVEAAVVELARRALVDGHVLELEHHVQLAPGRIGVEPRLFGCHPGHLADRDELAVAAAEDLAGHLGEVLVHVRSVGELVEGDDEPLPGTAGASGSPRPWR